MEFRALKKRSLVEMVEDQILTHIVTGGLGAGDYLPVESQLAKSFGVGKSTIREALRKLLARGIIDIVPRKGVCVCRVPDDLLEEGHIDLNLHLGPGHLLVLLEAHIALLTGCAWMACQKHTLMDMENLRGSLNKIDGTLRRLRKQGPTGSLHRRYESQYFEFYRLLSQASHNPLLIRLIDSMHNNLMENLPLARVFFVRDVREAEMLLELDRKLLDAMDDRDCGKALTLGSKKAKEIERIVKKSLKL